jgi:hypothetical protein
MRKLGQMLAVLAVVVASAGLIYAAATPAQKCQASKVKAVSKELGAKLKCIAKAASKGAPVDSACLMAAETKFTTAVGKAESKGGCALTGDGPTLGTSVDTDSNALAALTTAGPRGCCSGGVICLYENEPNCLADGGTPGAAGTVCDSPTGSCIPPPARPGPTCSNTFTTFNGSGVNCVAGLFLTLTDPPRSNELAFCQSYVGSTGDPNVPAKYDPNGICPPDGGRAVE